MKFILDTHGYRLYNERARMNFVRPNYGIFTLSKSVGRVSYKKLFFLLKKWTLVHGNKIEGCLLIRRVYLILLLAIPLSVIPL